MKYQEKSLTIQAYEILSTGVTEGGETILAIDNGESVVAGDGMFAGIAPAIGDYWGVKSDGHSFWMQKDAFEAKYDMLGDAPKPIATTGYVQAAPVMPVTDADEEENE